MQISATQMTDWMDKQLYKALGITHATSNLGIWLNGKIGFVFGRFGKSEERA
jgi:hypothetical protein